MFSKRIVFYDIAGRKKSWGLPWNGTSANNLDQKQIKINNSAQPRNFNYAGTVHF